MNQKQRLEILRVAVKATQKKGIPIIEGGFGVSFLSNGRAYKRTETDGVCPIGALCLHYQTGIIGYGENMKILLGLRTGEGDNFCKTFYSAFDGDDQDEDSSLRAFWLGKKLRKEFIKA